MKVRFGKNDVVDTYDVNSEGIGGIYSELDGLANEAVDMNLFNNTDKGVNKAILALLHTALTGADSGTTIKNIVGLTGFDSSQELAQYLGEQMEAISGGTGE